jgi:hypothetical protein
MTHGIPFAESVPVPDEVLREYQHLFFVKNLFQAPRLHNALAAELEQRLKDTLPVLAEPAAEVDSLDADSLSADVLKHEYDARIRPIVVRGYAKHARCVRLWNPDYFRGKYGDFPIFYTSADRMINDDGTRLADFVDRVVAGNKNRDYVENLSGIFNAHPELHADLELDRLGAAFGKYANYLHIAQLFIGGPGTGASFHCANELNGFLNIHGKKRWTLLHPKYSFAMYSTLMNKGFFVGSLVKHRAPVGFREAHFPLYNRVPRLTVTLEPGDLLINPPWWWHAVDNVTPVTISVATRWRIQTAYERQNPLFEFIQSHYARDMAFLGAELPNDDLVVSDDHVKKNYLSYEAMGWEASP